MEFNESDSQAGSTSQAGHDDGSSLSSTGTRSSAGHPFLRGSRRGGRGLVATFLIAAFAFVSVAMASGCRFSPEEKAEKVASHVASKLGLNDAQKAEFKKMADDAIADFRSMSSNRKEVAAEVEKQLVADKADPAALKKLVAANDVKRQELMAKWIDRAADFQSRLTPEQKQKALKMMQSFRERFESRFE